MTGFVKTQHMTKMYNRHYGQYKAIGWNSDEIEIIACMDR